VAESGARSALDSALFVCIFHVFTAIVLLFFPPDICNPPDVAGMPEHAENDDIA
jgi:hypothetical protein